MDGDADSLVKLVSSRRWKHGEEIVEEDPTHAPAVVNTGRVMQSYYRCLRLRVSNVSPSFFLEVNHLWLASQERERKKQEKL